KSGACALPARKLLDYVRLLADADISIKRLENHWVQVRCGRSNTRMVGMSRENFPELATFPPSGAMKIPTEPLRAMIAKTIFAIAAEETRYTLNGALMVLKPNSLALVTTDSHRLAHVVQDPLPLEGVAAEVKALVPRKAMAELMHLLDGAPEGSSLEFAQDETHLFFRLPDGSGVEGATRLLSARKLTGQFPNYEAVLPKSQLQSLPLNREEFTASIKRVDQFADERSHAIRVKIESNKVALAASSSDLGESEEELETEFSGTPLVIGFNARYLQDFLEAVAEEEVLLEIKDEVSAGQLRPRTSNGSQYRYVIMPMRI
ncbi:MAG TPA: DNA polymerase III subunit beta, partial [Terriglobales bacterium]|nr:DNA polymerase III subunit beta [Terriglobales bacterium]